MTAADRFPFRGHHGSDTPGALRRGLSLGDDDQPWSWFEGSPTTPRETEDWTRFEGVEGLSDTMLRSRRLSA